MSILNTILRNLKLIKGGGEEVNNLEKSKRRNDLMSNLRRGFLSLGLILGMFLGLVVSAEAAPGLFFGTSPESNENETRNVFANLCDVVVFDFELSTDVVAGDTIDTLIILNGIVTGSYADTDDVASLSLYEDTGTLGVYEPGVDVLASTTSDSGLYGIGAFVRIGWRFTNFLPGTGVIPSGVMKRYFVVMCVSPNLTGPDYGEYFDFRIPTRTGIPSGYPNGVETVAGDTNTLSMTDADSQLITQFGTLTFVQQDTVTLITASTDNNPVLTLIFSDTDEVTRIDTMPFTFSGTDNDTRNIVDLGLNKHIRIYRDDDGDTTFGLPGDTLISDTVTWDTSTGTGRWIVWLDGDDGETIPIGLNSEVWHVVVDVEDPDTATIGDTISLQVNIGSDTIYATGELSGATITATGSGTGESHWIVGRLDYSQTDAPPQALVTQCQTGVYMQTLRCTSTYEAILIDTITITDQGTNTPPDQNMSAIHLYLDDDATYDAATDQTNDQSGATTYLAGAYTISTSGLQIDTGTTRWLHIVYDISCTATVNDTVTAFIANDTDIVAEGLVSRTGSTTSVTFFSRKLSN